MKYFVGAYATAPITDHWDPALQTAYFEGLKGMSNVRGLEHPFTGTLHAEDEDWFLSTIDPTWDFVFTTMPGVMQRLGKNAEFGLASADEAGRQAALAFFEEARNAIHRLNRHLGRQAVSAILIQASPRVTEAGSPDADALAASLQTLASWDWDGAALVLEHCDAHVEGQAPAKGFLPLEAEIAAIEQARQAGGAPISICVNWGRSAIEARSVDGPVRHIEAARAAGLLKGLMFSGASDQESAYGAWRDTHMPPAQAFGIGAFEPTSLLTETEFQRCLSAAAASRLDVVGVKIAVRPDSMSVADRLSHVSDALHILDEIMATSDR